MASNLGAYDGCAGQREQKFIRAIESFIDQRYNDKELIIIADGCKITQKIYKEKYLQYPQIQLIKIPKQELFSGIVRQGGIEMANGKVICYLDTDDMFGSVDHLQHIINGFNGTNFDWVYFDDFLKFNHIEHIEPSKRICVLEQGSMGTSNIAHKNKPEVFNWLGCNGYGHDHWFIENRLLQNEQLYTKISGPQYLVCHIPGSIDV